jgi:hypothetical protein
MNLTGAFNVFLDLSNERAGGMIYIKE